MKRELSVKLLKIANYLEKIAKDYNPWAVCTESVGRDDKEKYEKCVMDIKKKNQEDKEQKKEATTHGLKQATFENDSEYVEHWISQIKGKSRSKHDERKFLKILISVLDPKSGKKYKEEEDISVLKHAVIHAAAGKSHRQKEKAARTAQDRLKKDLLKNPTKEHGPKKSAPYEGKKSPKKKG